MSHDSLRSSEPDASASAAPARLPTNVRLLGLASLLNDVAGEMIYPLFPAFFLQVLGGSKSLLGAVEGAAETTASLVKLWSGGASDKAGKRKAFVVVGYALAAVSRPFLAVATLPWQALSVRLADRFGKGVRAAPRDALVAESTDASTRGRAFGYTRAMDHLGAALGPLLSFAFLAYWPDDLRTWFMLAAVPGLFVVALVWFGLRERPVTTKAQKEFRLTLAPFDRRFKRYLLALAVFTLGNSSDTFLLVRVGELGVSNQMIPLLWSAFHVVKSVGSLIAGRAVDRFGPRPLIFGGWAIYAVIYVAFALATNAVQGWICFLVYGVFYALTEPAERALVASLVPGNRTGLAFGWFNFAIGIVALPASAIFGALYQAFGGPVAFGSSAALALVAVVILSTVGSASSSPPAESA